MLPSRNTDPTLVFDAGKILAGGSIRVLARWQTDSPSISREVILDYTHDNSGIGAWVTMPAPEGWLTTGLAVNSLGETCIVEQSGQALIESGSNPPRIERIALRRRSATTGPFLRDIAAVGQHFHAVTAFRQIYRRNDSGAWSRMDRGLALTPSLFNSPSIITDQITSLDGTSSDLYASTFCGLWHCRTGRSRGIFAPKWRNVTPAFLKADQSCILLKVLIVRDGLAYACGHSQNGLLLLRGWDDRWEPIPLAYIPSPTTGCGVHAIAWQAGRLVFATNCSLYEIDDSGRATPLDTGLPPEALEQIDDLHAAHGQLLVQTPSHILHCDSTARWRNITPVPGILK